MNAKIVSAIEGAKESMRKESRKKSDPNNIDSFKKLNEQMDKDDKMKASSQFDKDYKGAICASVSLQYELAREMFGLDKIDPYEEGEDYER